ncbi:hypothetical protein TREAZ_0511 [Leadbettera azotonutricia ZAS-9]|uniref:Uncharacterized protein n=1 Tax=Leadbettera azotonutricia (strain ATCC BAA-888 / DSM 13862 / ZAS-9) TaxID=545695 RepID=F5YC61_LEAAZ|nr:hypothetical protein TREAZ_0511 [Leadbettera azotonutricia ZAS-9]
MDHIYSILLFLRNVNPIYYYLYGFNSLKMAIFIFSIKHLNGLFTISHKNGYTIKDGSDPYEFRAEFQA